MSDRLERTSRRLAALLRHGAVEAGLHVRADGYAALDEVLALPAMRGVTAADVEAVVASSDKQRFQLRTDDRGVTWIKANQGHSLAHVTELELTPIEVDAVDMPAVVVHGTSRAGWDAIVATGGLHRMGRRHVHFAAGLPGTAGVISGMRSSSAVYVYLDVPAALTAGLRLFRSPNGVILTEGIDGGWVPLRLLSHAETRSGQALWFDRTRPVSAVAPEARPPFQRRAPPPAQ